MSPVKMWRPCTNTQCRVKLPKTFVAVNLSDAFSFQEKEKSQDDVLEMKGLNKGAKSAAAEAPEDLDPRNAVEEATELVPASDALPVQD